MIDLTDTKLTKQEKEFMLSLQTNKELREEVEAEKKNGFHICFPSFWAVEVADLIKFNKGAHQIDTCFDFDKKGLEEFHPNFDCLLFEGERVEIGEWDKTYKRWSSHSYQRVGVIFLHGKYYGFKNGQIKIAFYEPEEGQEKNMEFLYPASYGKNKVSKQSLGMIDIPLHLLNDYEDRRVNERTFHISKSYENIKRKYLKDREDYYFGVKKNKLKIQKCRNSNRKKKSFKKSFGGGFGL